MSKKVRQVAGNYVLILVGTAVMALAIQCIYDRVGLVTGGFTGLTIVIRSLTKSVCPHQKNLADGIFLHLKARQD